jgi:hypothetical protein
LSDDSEDIDILNVNSSSCAIVYDKDSDICALHVIEPSIVHSDIKELLPSQKLIYLFFHIYQMNKRPSS